MANTAPYLTTATAAQTFATGLGGVTGLYLSPDGTRLVVSEWGSANGSIQLFQLSTPFDLTTATATASSTLDTTVLIGTGSPSDVFMSPDGRNVFVSHSTLDEVQQLTLTNPWDLSAATVGNVLSHSAQDTSLYGCWFTADGLKLFTAGSQNDKIYRFDLTTAWDLTTATFIHSFYPNGLVSGYTITSPQAIVLNSDGTSLIMADWNTGNLYEFSLAIAYDLTTSSYVGLLDVSAYGVGESEPRGLSMSADNARLFTVGTVASIVQLFSVGVPGFGKTTVTLAPSTNVDPLGSLSLTSSKDVSANITAGALVNLAFGNAGNTAYYIKDASPTIWIYPGALTSPYDTATTPWLGSAYSSTAAAGNVVAGFAYAADGSAFYAAFDSSGTGTVEEWATATPWDVSTMAFTGQQTMTVSKAIQLSPDGTRFYSLSGNAIYSYQLATPYRIASQTLIGSTSFAALTAGTFTDFSLTDSGDAIVLLDDTGDVVSLHLNTPFLISSYIDRGTRTAVTQIVGSAGILANSGGDFYAVEKTTSVVNRFAVTPKTIPNAVYTPSPNAFISGSVTITVTPSSVMVVGSSNKTINGSVTATLTPASATVKHTTNKYISGTTTLSCVPDALRDGINAKLNSAILQLNQVVSGYEGIAYLQLEQRVAASGAASLILQQAIDYDASDVTMTVLQQVADSGNALLSLAQTVYDPVTVASGWSNWDIIVLVDGRDISADLTGQVIIDAGRSSARTVEFNVILSGAVNPAAWTGKQVTVDYVQNNGAVWRRFTGVIESPEYDVQTRILHCICTDNLQRIVDGYTNKQLDDLVSGYWSEDIFNPENKGWDYLQDVLKTVDKSVELSSDRQLQSNSLQNKPIADHLFDDTLVLDGSTTIQLANLNQLTNRIDITLDSRYKRLFRQQQQIIWIYPKSFCQSFIAPVTFPNQSLVQAAVEDAGWHFNSASLTPIWPTGFYSCYGRVVGFTNNFSDGIRGFNASCELHWQQTITESIKVTVKSQQSIDAYGESLVSDSRAAIDMDTQYPQWGTKGDDYTVTPSGMVADGAGNDRVNDADNGRIKTAFDTLVNSALTTILQSHRQNTVTFNLPLSPYIELSQTLQISDAEITAKGIVQRFTETYDFDKGSAITAITLSLSQGASGADITINTLPSAPGRSLITGPSIRNSIVLDTHIGGDVVSPKEDNSFTGVVTNISPPFPGANVYNGGSVSLKIPFPAIDDANRLDANTTIKQDINITIPDNILTITA